MLAVLSAALGTVVIACWQLSERSAHRGGVRRPGRGADLFQSFDPSRCLGADPLSFPNQYPRLPHRGVQITTSLQSQVCGRKSADLASWGGVCRRAEDQDRPWTGDASLADVKCCDAPGQRHFARAK